MDPENAARRYAMTYTKQYLARSLCFVLVPAIDRQTLELRCSAELFPLSLLVCPKGSTSSPVRRNVCLPLAAWPRDSVVGRPISSTMSSSRPYIATAAVGTRARTPQRSSHRRRRQPDRPENTWPRHRSSRPRRRPGRPARLLRLRRQDLAARRLYLPRPRGHLAR
jgi:hypothetical protein